MKGYLCTKLLLRQVPFWRKKEWKFRQLATRCKWINGRGCGWLLRETIKWDEMRWDSTTGLEFDGHFWMRHQGNHISKSFAANAQSPPLINHWSYQNGVVAFFAWWNIWMVFLSVTSFSSFTLLQHDTAHLHWHFATNGKRNYFNRISA